METGVTVRAAAALRTALGHLDGRPYPAYKALVGAYDFPNFRLYIDHIQADPFASPSHLRVRVPAAAAEIPRDLYRDKVRRVALQDYLIRAFAAAAREGGAPRRERVIGGRIAVDCGGQEVLERSAMVVKRGEGDVEARFVVGLPGLGRTVAGPEAIAILCDELPAVVERSLLFRSLPRLQVKRFVECVEDQAYLRHQLEAAGLVAFVADGAVLPRCSGCADQPLPAGQAVPFASPDGLRVTLDAPNAGPVTGMGIPRGVTLIVGGGFHGKSTLLNALERCVYNHVPDDGREQVVAVPGAVKIRAEDGRSVADVDISAFIGGLPGGIDTRQFRSDNASGSTSQAASIVEALEMGATCLLMDEDTCATNFMIRDARMAALVAADKEPIIPFVERVGQLYRELGVSTVLVMGGSGDYFRVADTVIMMDAWRPLDRTADARAIAASAPAEADGPPRPPLGRPRRRTPVPDSVDPSKGAREVKISARATHRLQFGAGDIDLAALSQLVDISQTRAVGEILVCLKRKLMNGELDLGALLDHVMRELDATGLDGVVGRPVGYLAMPRRFELGGALNRLRGVRFRQG